MITYFQKGSALEIFWLCYWKTPYQSHFKPSPPSSAPKDTTEFNIRKQPSPLPLKSSAASSLSSPAYSPLKKRTAIEVPASILFFLIASAVTTMWARGDIQIGPDSKRGDGGWGWVEGLGFKGWEMRNSLWEKENIRFWCSGRWGTEFVTSVYHQLWSYLHSRLRRLSVYMSDRSNGFHQIWYKTIGIEKQERIPQSNLIAYSKIDA